MPLIHRRAEPEVAEAPPPPIEFSSTGIWDWDGNDGNWSMIGIDVGSPSQQMSVLVSTSYKHLSLPLAPASEHTRTDHVIFQPNRSLTWIGQNSSSGFDVVSNVSENGSEEIVGNCSIFGMPTNDHTPWRGSLGLLPEPTNGNGFYFARPQQANVTILQSFKNKGSIPSLSFGYTAGAWYRNATTSLVLGGYDAAKIIYHDSSFRVSSYKNGTFLRLNLMSISLDASQSSRSVLPNPIVVSLDTSTPFLSMPRDVCEEFVSAFDLKFDESTGLYLVNSSTHSRLQAANSSLQLSLRGRGGSEGEVKIVLPYKSLDFVAYPPIYDQPTQYFPLKLVENGELAVLGRVFFQEAYVIVDYERSNFSIFQVPNVTSDPSIVPIFALKEDVLVTIILYSIFAVACFFLAMLPIMLVVVAKRLIKSRGRTKELKLIWKKAHTTDLGMEQGYGDDYIYHFLGLNPHSEE